MLLAYVEKIINKFGTRSTPFRLQCNNMQDRQLMFVVKEIYNKLFSDSIEELNLDKKKRLPLESQYYLLANIRSYTCIIGVDSTRYHLKIQSRARNTLFDLTFY
jgi:hypothetical protein